jgi:SAM-dependent methyltransferase
MMSSRDGATAAAALTRQGRADLVADLCPADQHSERARQLLRRVTLRPGARVLEVGCGTGQFLRALDLVRPPDVALVGVDTDAKALAIADRATRGLAGVSLIKMDGRALTFADQDFDLVCFSRVLVHSSNPALLLSEAARVLRPAGQMVLSEPAVAFATGIDDRLRQRVLGQRHPVIGRDLPTLLRTAGLRVQDYFLHSFVNDKHRDSETLRREFRSGRGLFAIAHRTRLCTTADVEAYLDAYDRTLAQGALFEVIVHAGVRAEKPAVEAKPTCTPPSSRCSSMSLPAR